MSIPNIDQSEFSNTLIKACKINSMEQIFSTNGLLKNLEKSLIESLLKCELTVHLEYGKNESAKDGNYRNGTGTKTINTTHGPLELEIPRDRNDTFEPQIVAKHQRNTKQIEDAVIHLYSQGL